jgi:riboflavin biosynthesis pyrimidine reductase
MKLCKSDVAGLSQVSPSVMSGEDSRPPVHRRRAERTIRLRGITCALADIQAQIERLQQERTYLSMVQEVLVGMEPQ